MSDTLQISPMLQHALESIEHAIQHYLEKTEVGRKFALLHIDHGIELALKEKLARIGTSIYRKSGRSIGFHEELELLGGIGIPERPRLEDLHDFRNIVQHKGLTPDELTTDFYVHEAYSFLKRFLQEELEINLAMVLSLEMLQTLERPDTFAALYAERRTKGSEELFEAGDYEMALISAFAALETAVKENTPGWGWVGVPRILEAVLKDKHEQLSKLRWVIGLRNKVAHTGAEVGGDEVRDALCFLHTLITDFVRERRART